MSGLSMWALPVPVSAVLGFVTGMAYLLISMRSRRGEFKLIDALIMVSLMAAVTAVAIPLLSAADNRTKSLVLTQNLQMLRTQIERYKLDHGGQPPLAYKGMLPQLTQSTDSQGIPGPRDKEHAFGPYFSGSLPANPYTNSSIVELTETFPPSERGTAGGWLYHQPTGQIAADQEGWLEK